MEWVKNRIDYCSVFLFLVAIAGSILFYDFFVDKFYTSQSVCLLFILLIDLFVILLLSKNTIGYPAVLFYLCGAILFCFSSVFCLYNELICVIFVVLLIKFIFENLKIDISFLILHISKYLSIIGFVEAVWGFGQYLYLLPVYESNYRIVGTFDNPAGFAVCISSIFPFYLVLLYSSTIFWKMTGYLFSFTSGCVLLLSGSRTGLLAVLVVFVVHFYVYYFKQGIRIFNKNQIGWWVCMILVCLVIGLYYFKKDSADGRLLIWRVTWNMIKDSPLIGHGAGSFQAKYMLYQADYFRLYPNSHFAQLADNISHPFNEFLKIAAEYGCLGLIMLFFLIGKGIYIFKRNTNIMKYPVIESIIAIAVCACFSYPLKYPVTWGILGLAISVICVQQERSFKLHIPCIRYFGTGISLYLIFLLLQYVSVEMKWKKIVDRSFLGETEQVLPFYEQLRGELGTNGLFLYNYAAELHVMKSYDKSIELLTECILYWNDYDVQLLLADCYLQKEKFEKAEECFVLASNMCPNRFIPLYQLVHLYDRIGQKEKAYDLAEKIIHKTVKISSFKVQRIKNEMIEYVQKGI